MIAWQGSQRFFVSPDANFLDKEACPPSFAPFPVLHRPHRKRPQVSPNAPPQTKAAGNGCWRRWQFGFGGRDRRDFAIASDFFLQTA